MNHWEYLKAECKLKNVRLMVVSKGQPSEKILPFLKAGQVLFGESRIQETANKWPSLKKNHSNIELHLIGSLQTNKVKQAIQLFDCIQSVDRANLAQVLKDEMIKLSLSVPLMIQINLGDEIQKGGICPSKADSFIKYCKDELKLPIIGLMAIPPLGKDPTPYFKDLINLADRHNLPERSIGMSSDYEKAVQCGSTLIRIGRALFSQQT